MLLWGETEQLPWTRIVKKNPQVWSVAVFPTSLSVLPDLQFWPTWTSPTLVTWAQPSPRGRFTWPRPTRTNCGSSAVKEVWSESPESCRGPAPAEGQLCSSVWQEKRWKQSNREKKRTEFVFARVGGLKTLEHLRHTFIVESVQTETPLDGVLVSGQQCHLLWKCENLPVVSWRWRHGETLSSALCFLQEPQ